MKRIWTASLLFSVAALAACSASSADSALGGTGGGADKSASPGVGGGSSSSGGSSGTSSGGASEESDAPAAGDGEKTSDGTGAPGSPAQPPQAGILTAGVWDDNLNFNFFQKYVELSASLQGLPSFSLLEREAAHAKWGQRTGASELDIAFLIDTTGSMGDELKYLQQEIDGIAQSIQTKNPQMTARYGLVLYRDQGDEYVTRWFDFKGIDEFRAKLAVQTVGGGGDYPEGVSEGLDQVLKLSWRSGAVARMAFWVADAPHHVGQEQAVRATIDVAVQKDVHVYPVAASGTDPRAEFTMRTAAQITGGRYVFLTNDSGVGNSHAEPHIPCYHVTKFDGALVRMVDSELKGAPVAPAPADIIRTVGNPTNGQCATKTQGNVTIY